MSTQDRTCHPEFERWSKCSAIWRSLLLLLIAASSCAQAGEPSAQAIIEAVRGRIPSVVGAAEKERIADTTLAGLYSAAPETKGYSGYDVYLFSDSTYMCVEWGCVMLRTICEKGTWRFDGSLVRLSTDKSVEGPYLPRTDRVYLPVKARVGDAPEMRLFLLGFPARYRFFEEMAGDWPGSTFMVAAHLRVGDLAEPEKIRAQLMKDSWNPSFYGK